MAYMSILEMRKALASKYSKEWVAKKSDAQILAIYRNSTAKRR